MTMVKDLVCGMEMGQEKAAATVTHQGQSHDHAHHGHNH